MHAHTRARARMNGIRERRASGYNRGRLLHADTQKNPATASTGT